MDISYIEKNTDCKIEYYTEITSTNDRAKEIAEKVFHKELEESRRIRENGIMREDFAKKENFENELENVRVVIAEKQTKGKGTNGRVWLSHEGENILMTLLFYPNKKIQELKNITYQIAEMIQSAIKDLYDVKLSIKLPNDLLLNEKKICGILTESSIQKEKVNYLLVGIGFNVNQIIFPEELNEIATSLKRENPEREWSREEIIIKIINRVKSLF